MTLKDKNDIKGVIEKECDNKLSKFTSYFDDILERISNEKNAFKLATLAMR